MQVYSLHPSQAQQRDVRRGEGRELMPKSYHDQLTVEKTPAYFVSSEVPQRVFDLDPNMKLLLVVRDPVTRAISDYCQAASKHPVKPFERMAMENGIQGQIHANWSAIRIGLYAQHMARWLNVFPPSQFYVVDGQRLVDHPAAELTQVEKFLGISSFIRDSHFRLRSFKGKFPCLVREDGSVHCLNERSKGRAHPVVQENVLHRLRKFYKPHNERFFNMRIEIQVSTSTIALDDMKGALSRHHLKLGRPSNLSNDIEQS
ncbi:hypothetical protein RRG08_044636 [Elysia crispata]|uniref:Sulfotransferase domain-containing protein n=1 Tax=Elysia crispata TaxID=231223 RepID=A0AAE0YM23_9GAST|nr:hypothetical protein RRG08_044636 [Elysia crispata]